MKLCIIGNPNSIHILRWVRYFSSRGHDVHLVGIRSPRNPIPENVNFHDLTLSINIRKVSYIFWMITIRKIIYQIQPDILHAHFINGAGWLGATTGFHPFIVTSHGSDLLIQPDQSWVFKLLARWTLRKADCVICVSHKLASRAKYLGVSSEKLHVIPLGVDTSTFRPQKNRPSLRADLKLGNGPIIVSIRAIQAIYNPLDIARAITVVLKHEPSVQFIIFTYNHDKELLRQFKQIIQKAQMSPSVMYIEDLANDHEIARYLQIADIAISIASSDGTPISVLETMACGTPVILGDIPAFRGWIQNEYEALLVPLHDIGSLSSTIIRLLNDANLRKHLSSQALGYIHKNKDSRIWMRKSEEVYLKVAKVKK